MTTEGYQFAHVDVHSIQGAAKMNGVVPSHRKNGERAWTTAEILEELERQPWASGHVIPDRPGIEILPGSCRTIAELREAHAKAAATKLPFGKPNAAGKRMQRKIRVDQPSLYTCVVSLPVLTADALADPIKLAEAMEVLEAAVETEAERIETAGGVHALSVVHWDESHLHVHIIGLDPSRVRVDELHPGRVAKAAREEELKASGWTKKAINQSADAAYCDAMRAWQDDFHRSVFSDAGLLRTGPRRLRLSRPEYNAAKAAKAEEARARRALAEERREIGEQRRSLMKQHDTALTLEDERAVLVREEDEALASERRRNDAESREIERREGEVEASMATIEAMSEGVMVFTAEEKFRPTNSFDNGAWHRFLTASRGAPGAARAIARRLSVALGKAHDRAREEGLTEARQRAAEEVRERLTALEQATASIAAVSTFARRLINRIGGREGASLNAELDALAERGVKEAARAKVVHDRGRPERRRT